jgi:hypothetical protein
MLVSPNGSLGIAAPADLVYSFHYQRSQGNLTVPAPNVGTGADTAVSANDRLVFAAAYMLQPSPGLVCSYFDGQDYTSSTGVAYAVVCDGADYIGNGGTFSRLPSDSNLGVGSLAECIAICDSTQGCTAVSYIYYTLADSHEEPAYGADNNNGGYNLGTGSATAIAVNPPLSANAIAYQTAYGPATTPRSYVYRPSPCLSQNDSIITDAQGVQYYMVCSSTLSGIPAQHGPTSEYASTYMDCLAQAGVVGATVVQYHGVFETGTDNGGQLQL